jgi:autotransporter translocation and assembly factor TamB
VSFAVSGTPRDLHGGATVQLSRLFYNTVRLNAATARLDYQDGVVYVRSLRAADPRGRLVAAGTVGQKGDLHLQVRAKGINLAALLAPFTKERASGTAYFSGGIGGTVRDPRLAGQLQVYAGRLGSVSTDYAEGQVVVRSDQVQAAPLVMRIYPGQVTVRGVVGGWREARTRLNLHATASDLSIARLLAMANLKTKAAGTLSGQLSLQGTPAVPVATAALQVEDLLVEGTQLGTAAVHLETDGRRLRVRQASIQGDALAATAQGSIGLVPTPTQTGPERARAGVRVGTAAGSSAVRSLTKESPLDLTFAVQRLDLARAASRAGGRVVLVGIAKATDGVVRGRLGAPVVTARVEAAPIAVNTVSFAGLSGSIAYTRERVVLRDAELRDSGGAIRVAEASLRPLPNQPLNGLTVDATVAAFPLQEAIAIAQRTAAARGGAPAAGTVSAQEVSGPVSGTITARPETTRPGAPAVWTVALTAPALTVPGYRIPPEGAANPAAGSPLSVGMELRASYRMTGLLTLERLAITRDEGLLQVRGSMVREGGLDAQGKELPRGQIVLRADATEIPMSLFGPLAPALHPLRGTAELHVDATGPLRAPAVQGSLDVDKIVLAGVPFSHFAIPFIRLGAPLGGGLGSLQIEAARLEQDDKDHPSGQHYLLVDGRLPFFWQSDAAGMAVRGLIPTDQPLSLAVRLPEQSLDVLNTLSKLDPAGVNPRIAPALHALGSLSAVSGTMAADLKVTGTREQPDASGSFQIANGALQPQQGETRFDRIGVRLGFTGNRIDVQQFEGRSSRGGDFMGSGSITGLALGVGEAAPAAQLNLALALNDLQYTERNLTGYLQERFRGTLRTVERGRSEQPAPLRLTGDWRSPTLTGAIQVRSARLGLPASLPEAQSRVFIPSPNPHFQLDVLLDRDVWLENPRLRMQMTGLLPIRGTLARPTVIGTLIVQRGTMTFPTARFRLEGSVDVAYAPGETAPGAAPAGGGGPAPLRVDLTATARVRGTDPRSGQRQRYDVTLVIRGPLTSDVSGAATSLVSDERLSGDRLTIEARSDPPLSEQEILALLGRGASIQGLLQANSSAPDILRREVGDVFTASVLPTFFVPIETAIEDWLGLEEFSVDFAFQEPVQITLTKQLYGPLFATYTRNINAGGSFSASTNTINSLTPTTALNLYTLEFYYRISNRLRFGYRLEEPSHNRVFLLNGTLRF